jgi:hypothetical protein
LKRSAITYEWEEACDETFGTLKGILVKVPVLKLPDFDKLLSNYSFANSSLAPTRVASCGIGGCVMGVFRHGTTSSMSLEVAQISIMMWDDQDSLILQSC